MQKGTTNDLGKEEGIVLLAASLESSERPSKIVTLSRVFHLESVDKMCCPRQHLFRPAWFFKSLLSPRAQKHAL